MVFGRRRKKGTDTPAPATRPTPPPPPSEPASLDGLAAERRALYETLGSVGDDVLAPIFSEDLLGGAPAWPTREGHRVIETADGHLIFATDGLTDAWPDGTPGLAYEIMLKIPRPDDYSGPANAASLFEFGVHRELAWNALTWPDLRPILAENGVASMVLPGTMGASPLVGERNGEGQVGALIGSTVIAGPVTLIGMTLVLPDELLALERGGQETRPALAKALDSAGIGWASIANRAPVQF